MFFFWAVCAVLGFVFLQGIWRAVVEFSETRQWHALAPVFWLAVLFFGVYSWFKTKPFRGVPLRLGRDHQLHWFGGSFNGLYLTVGIVTALFIWRMMAVARQRREYAENLRDTEPPTPSSGASGGAGPERLKDSGLV